MWKKTNSKKTFAAVIPLECYLQNKTSTNFSFFGQQQSPALEFKQMAMEQKNILRKLNLTFEFRTEALLEEPKESNGNHLTVFFFNS